MALVPTLEPDPAGLGAQRAQLAAPLASHGAGAGAGAGLMHGAPSGAGHWYGGAGPGGVDGLGLALRCTDIWPGTCVGDRLAKAPATAVWEKNGWLLRSLQSGQKSVVV